MTTVSAAAGVLLAEQWRERKRKECGKQGDAVVMTP
jgi:hypothetical protein